MRYFSKFNYYYYSFLILACSFSLYAVKLTEYSPIYLIYLVTLPISFLFLLADKGKVAMTSDVILIFLFLGYVLIFHFSHLNNGSSVNLIISLLGYIYFRIARLRITLKQYSSVIQTMVVFNLIILGLDSLYRILNPTHPDINKIDIYSDSQDKWFYLYKFNSLMFSDSNDTALVLIVLLFTLMSLPDKYFYFNKVKFYFFISGLLFFTFSRAAYLVTILGILKHKFDSFSPGTKLIIRILAFLSIIISASFIYTVLLSDDSFAVRLDIISLVFDFQNNANLSTLLIGIGPGQSESALGIYTHIFYLTYIIELGILGLVMVLVFFFSYMHKYGSTILFPVLIVGLSFFLYLGTPFLFIPLALVANIYDSKICKI